MKKVALIPARMESSRLPNKPLYELRKVPMIKRVYDRVKQCDILDEVYVCSGDTTISNYCMMNDIPFIITTQPHVSGTDRIFEASNTLNLCDDDIILNVQGDVPVIPELALSSLLAMKESVECDIATLATRKPNNYEFYNTNNVKVLFDREFKANYFSRTGIPVGFGVATPHAFWYHHVGIYAYTKTSLTAFVELGEGDWEAAERLEQLRALQYGMTIKVRPVNESFVDVNTYEDVDIAERAIRDAECN